MKTNNMNEYLISNPVFYSKGYKYQLRKDFITKLAYFNRLRDIKTDYCTLIDGELHVFVKYAWDGASGPTIDTVNTIRGSLVHDVLYQLIRDGHLPFVYWEKADDELYRFLAKDGMSSVRVGAWEWGLDFADGEYAKDEHKKPILIAP